MTKKDEKVANLMAAWKLIEYSMHPCHNKDVVINHIYREILRLGGSV